MTRLAWHPLARVELAEAADFYEGESIGLGDIFVDAVERGVLMIEEHPASGRKVLRGVRMILLSRSRREIHKPPRTDFGLHFPGAALH